MAADAAVTQELAHQLRVPESAADYRDIIESLPDLMRTQGECLTALAEDLSNRGGAGVQDTVGSLHELSAALGSATESAEQAALAFGEEAEFWLGGQ